MAQGNTQRDNEQTRKGAVDIPVKNMEMMTIIVTKEIREFIENLAMENLEKTGKYSKAEAARQLITAGAKALGKKK